jgi:ferredoxin
LWHFCSESAIVPRTKGLSAEGGLGQESDVTKRLRIIADVGSCCGYGACKVACPEIFQLGQGGLVALTTDVVPEGLEAQAWEGVDSCPQMALKIEEFED